MPRICNNLPLVMLFAAISTGCHVSGVRRPPQAVSFDRSPARQSSERTQRAKGPSEGEIAIARKYEQCGELKKARLLYSIMAETYPEHSFAHHRLGVLAAREGDHELAERHFHIALGLPRAATEHSPSKPIRRRKETPKLAKAPRTEDSRTGGESTPNHEDAALAVYEPPNPPKIERPSRSTDRRNLHLTESQASRHVGNEEEEPTAPSPPTIQQSIQIAQSVAGKPSDSGQSDDRADLDMPSHEQVVVRIRSRSDATGRSMRGSDGADKNVASAKKGEGHSTPRNAVPPAAQHVAHAEPEAKQDIIPPPPPLGMRVSRRSREALLRAGIDISPKAEHARKVQEADSPEIVPAATRDEAQERVHKQTDAARVADALPDPTEAALARLTLSAPRSRPAEERNSSGPLPSAANQPAVLVQFRDNPPEVRSTEEFKPDAPTAISRRNILRETDGIAPLRNEISDSPLRHTDANPKVAHPMPGKDEAETHQPSHGRPRSGRSAIARGTDRDDAPRPEFGIELADSVEAPEAAPRLWRIAPDDAKPMPLRSKQPVDFDRRPLFTGDNPLEFTRSGPTVRRASHGRLDDPHYDPLDAP